MGLYDYRYYLADENECRKLLYEIRWPSGVECPRCSHKLTWKLGKEDRYKHECRRCKYKFTETSGTIFEKTRTPISKWICAIGLFKIGISANQLKDEIRVTYKAAWQILAKIRMAIKDDRLTNQLSGRIEVDEAYFGGRRKGIRGRGAAGKTPIIGIIQRDGDVRAVTIPNVSSKTLLALVREHVEAGSTIYTDSYVGYKGLADSGFSHKIVNHQKSFVSRKGHHTNSIEGFCGYRKTTCTRGITRSLESTCRPILLKWSSDITTELIQISYNWYLQSYYFSPSKGIITYFFPLVSFFS